MAKGIGFSLLCLLFRNSHVVKAMKSCGSSCFFLSLLIVPQHSLAEEGETVEDEATAEDEADDHNPMLPGHRNDAQSCDLKFFPQIILNIELWKRPHYTQNWIILEIVGTLRQHEKGLCNYMVKYSDALLKC